MDAPVSPALRLRRATIADVATALAWTPEDEALRRWAGPGTRCPATVESLWEDIVTRNPAAATYAFESAGDGLIGVGQVRRREPACGHLARIVVSPALRGRGFGRALCRALMHEAARLHPGITCFTLYVYPDNAPALALYHSLGFVAQPGQERMGNLLLAAPLTAQPAG